MKINDEYQWTNVQHEDEIAGQVEQLLAIQALFAAGPPKSATVVDVMVFPVRGAGESARYEGLVIGDNSVDWVSVDALASSHMSDWHVTAVLLGDPPTSSAGVTYRIFAVPLSRASFGFDYRLVVVECRTNDSAQVAVSIGKSPRPTNHKVHRG